MADTSLDTDSQITEVGAGWQAPSVGALPLHSKDIHFFDPKFEVVLEHDDDPIQFSLFKKWMIELTICTAALCVASASSAVRRFLGPAPASG